jgi:hypothetical protein
MNIVVIYIFCILGIVSRTLLPFFQTLRDEPNTKWDNKFLVPPVASLVINLMIAPFVFRELPAGADWITAYIIGWGVQDICREVAKSAGNIPALNGLK